MKPIEPRIVVGASHAGAEMALRLRQLDPSVPVLLLGEEPLLPYQRPPLSKSWIGNPLAEAEALLIRPAAAYVTAGVEVRTGVRVVRIDRDRRQLMLHTGDRLGYRQLALATGARPRRLAVAAGEGAAAIERAGNFHYVRTHADAQRLRSQFIAGARLVIVGGGYIGLELAALARRCQLQVTVLEAQPRVLARVTAPRMSTFYEKVHREAGVEIHTGVQAEGIELDEAGRATAVIWPDGRAEADMVVVGVGVVPNVELAREAGLVCAEDGLQVDALCRTSGPSIVAAGDCTSRPVAGHERTMRIESVPNAMEQARSAAATLCGLEQPCLAVPWFWSDQYDLKLQMVGLSRGHDQVILRGLPESRSFTAFYLKESRLIAADAVNRPADFMAARRLVGSGASVEPGELADPAVDLKMLATLLTGVAAR